MSGTEVNSSWLSDMPSTDDLRVRTKRMILVRLNGDHEDLLEVKTLSEALRVVKDDYSGIVTNVESEFSDISDSDYEKMKGSYIEISSGAGGDPGYLTIYVYVSPNIKGQENESRTLVYKFYNFKESNVTINSSVKDIVKYKKVILE
jgi:hypothetical protein